jgi:glycosyltransferase involved in cell wall biosynthesis
VADGPEIILSIVVPMYNKEDAVDAFIARVEPVAEAVVAPLRRPYEIVCVDDGSSDRTLEKLHAHRQRNPAIKIVSLSRNFGKDLALTAGLDHAAGAAVVPIDSDLQDPPEVIPELFANWLEGNEVVYAGYLIVCTLVHGVGVSGYASLMVVLLFMGGINLLTLGIIAEYVGRIYTGVKRRPHYLVRRITGSAHEDDQLPGRAANALLCGVSLVMLAKGPQNGANGESG